MVIIRLKLLAIFRMVHDMPGKRVRLIFFNIPERTGHHNIASAPIRVPSMQRPVLF